MRWDIKFFTILLLFFSLIVPRFFILSAHATGVIINLGDKKPEDVEKSKPGLAVHADSDTTKYAVVFDFDTDSCYSAQAIYGKTGQVNGGLRARGSITGKCRRMGNFVYSNTFTRNVTVKNNNKKYSVYMYALYFEKDAYNRVGGHRHDWEHALVWVTDGSITHVSVSKHGGVTTKSAKDVPQINGRYAIVYHKDGVRTHSMRFAKKDEVKKNAENYTKKWVTPNLAQWDLMSSSGFNNKTLRTTLTGYDFGSAVLPLSDDRFVNQITKSIPSGYPNATKWQTAVDDE